VQPQREGAAVRVGLLALGALGVEGDQAAVERLVQLFPMPKPAAAGAKAT
jgi:hypothetical protein